MQATVLLFIAFLIHGQVTTVCAVSIMTQDILAKILYFLASHICVFLEENYIFMLLYRCLFQILECLDGYL